MILGVEFVAGLTVAGSVAGVPMSLITPVAGLSTGNLAGALGSFVWAVAAFVFANVVDRSQRSREEDVSTNSEAAAASPEDPSETPADPPDHLRMAA